MGSETSPDELLEQARQEQHPRCIVCSEQHTCGLKVEYAATDEGGVAATFECLEQWQGYSGLVHGGVIASLLDGAMTNCLFAEGIVAYTADLQVRYKRPLHVGTPAQVVATVSRRNPPLFVLKSKIVQEGRVRAIATGMFMTNDNQLKQLWNGD
ncbi:PaaI family thioesterase [Aeoliella mucimassa]|uniref:Acyl-coenzyme A thioesterase THEM4 n=1 Tax=Aeoliella mucimassa TaxID=2527972 RepID=A0A518AW39_9BACT|nr:PaaI family thioesterase [Aeoliella mucimassa]QDU58926.1 Thioesterase superfamily protein [Aeoliella mucimassa]